MKTTPSMTNPSKDALELETFLRVTREAGDSLDGPGRSVLEKRSPRAAKALELAALTLKGADHPDNVATVAHAFLQMFDAISPVQPEAPWKLLQRINDKLTMYLKCITRNQAVSADAIAVAREALRLCGDTSATVALAIDPSKRKTGIGRYDSLHPHFGAGGGGFEARDPANAAGGNGRPPGWRTLKSSREVIFGPAKNTEND